ncbi:MAG: ABC transporter ATP-binding protein [Clostridiales bacterium]|jgi:putative ABC transport system ATP-binding protein|nr:ABC transporter ATP-binding protein [Clostridiales bacterium]MCI1960591.1 ABC transporter ATP-binding protein [Clostridiales bacterium]MCI2021078.1 ABC transporter ATP-binding protein [Clostridiales bacterium]MCI2025461.1 ABC transporter ATP-binding protein [Clostridiales bacterium]
MSILELKNLSYSYDGIHPILKDITYTFEQGKVYAIMGKSGAGKTTLLSLLSGLAKPTSGTILFQDKDITTIDRYHYRSKYVGVVFQGFNLLPQLTAVENVELSMDISGMKIKDWCEVAMNLLDKVELDEVKANRRVLKLSGGEQQRVAIARALSYNPDILLADEPTGNLDGETQDAVMNIFLRLAQEENKCVIIVTHSPEVARQADIVYELKTAKSAECSDLSPLQ